MVDPPADRVRQPPRHGRPGRSSSSRPSSPRGCRAPRRARPARPLGAAHRRDRRRRVLGAFVVYSKLNPWLVSLHMVSQPRHGRGGRGRPLPPLQVRLRRGRARRRARPALPPRRPALCGPLRRDGAGRGTVATGAGPARRVELRASCVARRLPIALIDATWIHSAAAVLFIGLVTGTRCSRSGAPTCPTRCGLGVRRLVSSSPGPGGDRPHPVRDAPARGRSSSCTSPARCRSPSA